MAPTDYSLPLTVVLSFKYLVRVLLAPHEDWPVVIRDLWRARKKWEHLSQVIGQEV